MKPIIGKYGFGSPNILEEYVSARFNRCTPISAPLLGFYNPWAKGLVKKESLSANLQGKADPKRAIDQREADHHRG